MKYTALAASFGFSLAIGGIIAGESRVDPAWVSAYENAHTKGRSEMVGMNNQRSRGRYRWRDDQLRGPGHVPKLADLPMCGSHEKNAGKCLIDHVYEWSGFLIVMVTHVASPGAVDCDHEIRPPTVEALQKSTGVAYIFDPITGRLSETVDGETGGDATVYAEDRYLYLVFDGQLTRISTDRDSTILEEVWNSETLCAAPEMNCWVKSMGDGKVVVEWSVGGDVYESKALPLVDVMFKPWPH